MNGGDDAGVQATAYAFRNDFLAATCLVLLREDRFLATLLAVWKILRHDCGWIGAVEALLGGL